MSEGLSIWTIYDSPSDYPGQFVARCFISDAIGVTPTGVALFAGTLGAVRAMLPPGLHRIPRYEQDDPKIVEVWL
jgi:hypothetical protein